MFSFSLLLLPFVSIYDVLTSEKQCIKDDHFLNLVWQTLLIAWSNSHFQIPYSVYYTKAGKAKCLLSQTLLKPGLTVLVNEMSAGSFLGKFGSPSFFPVWKEGMMLGCVSQLATMRFSSVQSLSRFQLFATPWTAACQASLFITNSRSSPKLVSIESLMPSSHLILCRPLLLLPPIPPSIRVFSNESTLHMRWPKY